MANNRLYIVCRKCEDFIALAKFYPPGSFLGGEIGWAFGYTDVDRDEWIIKHEKHASKLDINGGEYFAFITEQDDKVKSYDFDKRKIKLAPLKQGDE
jgi:hypothetical protein